jgi:hypothetical protein
MRISCLTAFALPLLCILLCVPIASEQHAYAGQSAPARAQKQQGGGWWWYCTSGPYMTGVFFYPADIETRADIDAAIQAAWSNWVTKNHPNENLGTGCTLGGTDQASTQRIHDHVRASNKGSGVIDVDWKYVPGKDTPTTASGPIRLYYCSAYFGPNGGENLAFSDSFEAPRQTDMNRVRDDFVKFVSEKYSAKDANGGCSKDDKAKEESNMRGHKKIIETGWKPKTSPVSQSQDPRLANLPPERRQLLQVEVVRSKDYCTNNQVLSDLFDCTCFAQSALDYHIKHADEKLTVGEAPPIINIMAQFDVRQCVAENKVLKLATETANSHGATNLASCIGPAMVKSLRTHPDMSGTPDRRAYTEALAICSKQR